MNDRTDDDAAAGRPDVPHGRPTSGAARVGGWFRSRRRVALAATGVAVFALRGSAQRGGQPRVIADGAVFAKTGRIDTGYMLSGIIHAGDGTPLTFAVYALRDVRDNAKQAIDTITTGFFRWGDNLSNN